MNLLVTVAAVVCVLSVLNLIVAMVVIWRRRGRPVQPGPGRTCGTAAPCKLSGSRHCDGDHPDWRCVACGAWAGEDDDRDHSGGGCVR